MLMADDRSNLLPSGDSSFDDGQEFSGNLAIDMETFMDILGEPDPQQKFPNDFFWDDITVGPSRPSSDRLYSSAAFSPLDNLESSNLRAGIFDGSSDNGGKSVACNHLMLESSLQLRSPVNSGSGGLTDWMPVQDMDKGLHSISSSNPPHCPETVHQRPKFGDLFSFDAVDFNLLADNRDDSSYSYPSYGNGFQFNCLEGDYLSENLSSKQFVQEDNLKASVVPNMETPLMEIELPDNRSSEYHNPYFSAPYVEGKGDPSCSTHLIQFLSDKFDFEELDSSDDKTLNTRTEAGELLITKTSLNNTSILHDWNEKVEKRVSEAQILGNLYATGLNALHDSVSNASSNGVPSFSENNNAIPEKQESCIKEEKDKRLIAVHDISHQLSTDHTGSSGQRLNPSYSDFLNSGLSENPAVFAKKEEDIFHESKRQRLSRNVYDGTAPRKCQLNVGSADPPVVFSSRIKSEFVHRKVEKESKPNLPNMKRLHVSNINGQVIQRCFSSQRYTSDDDDDDVCILEDISGPARLSISAVNGKTSDSVQAVQRTVICDSFNTTAGGHVRHKENSERCVFQAAMQDLCQSKSEDAPPDGVLSVSLLRHQRIALSWMVKKEKDVSRCSGGILADDQGLGKTVSTIALILKERSPSSIGSNTQSRPETLNLDDDDDCSPNLKNSAQGAETCLKHGCFSGDKNKQRPSAGTLIVCPTSVLRQWSDELQNKVTDKANLSVLVYHGSNRTKDPFELAKYDVVVTTYAIVSMEVPKQPLVDEDDEIRSASGSPVELSSYKKRKYPPSAGKKSLKNKKGKEDELVEHLTRPLASVRWFRVVLDEAQSIKNHRTQVARACWGLRAKRRWCLSGTPIQNAVDDLYSYFRFLRYDPYSVYKLFCSGIKVPIQRNPATGYRKLQAVLKTVMLRRTKGTLLDGKPIINLPPKTVKLKRVDFTREERDFYCRLEADSRAQFAEYAAAGTVKQNYVNILLMLLRLRQACDHPFLVTGSSSRSKQRSSVEKAKELPREKQIHLLNCLQASLAICGICNDPPEDAVVTSCGHVFCNQCIYERLTGDDTNCPTTNCKTHLSPSLVFSLETLRSSLSGLSVENNADCTDMETPETSDPFSFGPSYGSSKIKAAFEVLQSLTKGKDCSRMNYSTSTREGTSIAENTNNIHFPGSCEILHNDKNPRVDKVYSKDSVAVVGKKAIVFSQWTRMLDLLEACLKNSSIQYRRLDGTMSVVARDRAVKDFNTLPEVSVMIMSLKAASLGLNMVAACHVLLLDLWWNPTTEDQAIDRAHRIGQTRPVTVFRLTVKDTVEDRILALQQKKREMVASAFGEDENGSRQTRLTVEDLNYLFMDRQH